MKFKTAITLFALLLSTSFVFAQSITGTWKTIDDNSGEARSFVEIVEKGGKFYGNIKELIGEDPSTVCEKCEGDKKDQPLVGLEIIWDIKPYKDYWSYGKIMDPESGKTYKCNIALDGTDKLEVRGYIGFSLMGRTQTWHRVK